MDLPTRLAVFLDDPVLTAEKINSLVSMSLVTDDKLLRLLAGFSQDCFICRETLFSPENQPALIQCSNFHVCHRNCDDSGVCSLCPAVSLLLIF